MIRMTTTTPPPMYIVHLPHSDRERRASRTGARYRRTTAPTVRFEAASRRGVRSARSGPVHLVVLGVQVANAAHCVVGASVRS